MDGLECSEVSFGYIKSLNEILRLDSYYFAKEFIEDENLLNEISNKRIAEIGATIRSFGAYSLNNEVEYQNDGVPFIRGVNMKNGLVDFHNLLYISPSANKLLWKSEVFPNTILLSMSGSLGDVAIARENWQYPINSNQDIAKIEFGDNINPYYVYTFLKSRYGQNYIRREARGSVQQHVFLSQIEQFKIPMLSSAFQLSIEHIVREAYSKNDCSNNIYHLAEKSILKYICLEDMYSTGNNTCIKTYKTSYCKSNRLDAEYFQPKYEKIESMIKHYSGGYDYVKNLCTFRDENYIPLPAKDYKYVELSNIDAYGQITDCTIGNGETLPTRARRIVKTNDVIVSSIEGSLQSCALVESTYHNAICSTGFYVINSTRFNPETLLLLFKSAPIQNLLKKGCSGTILTAISKNELGNIPLPLIEDSGQKELANKIQESFSLRKQSYELLERAKTAVEMAIEQGEETALGWLLEMDKNQCD